MKTIPMKKEHLPEVIKIALRAYQMEYMRIPEITTDYKETMERQIRDTWNNHGGLVCVEEDKVFGYFMPVWIEEDEKKKSIYYPVWGYGAVEKRREQILSRLFEAAAKMEYGTKKLHYQVQIYAHDIQALRLFSYLQFGIESEKGILQTSKLCHVQSAIPLHELSKQELKERWNEVWGLLSKLIDHLKQSPVFYPGTEFTESVYYDFFVSESVRVFVAEEKNHMIGMIEANQEGNDFHQGKSVYNVGEAYVLPEYRGTNLSKALLFNVGKLLEAEGVHWLWVEHGTANPNARGFWNKYFKTYSYAMIRDIDSKLEENEI